MICDKCRAEKLARYRPEILTRYSQADVDRLRGRAVEDDLHFLDRVLGDLADKGAEHFGKLDEAKAEAILAFCGPLAELLAKYEDGTQLLKVCENRLKEAELKIEQLKKQKDGSAAFYEFNVRLPDGSLRQSRDPQAGTWQVGDGIQLLGGGRTWSEPWDEP